MRIIVSPEVIQDLNAKAVIDKPIDCYGVDIIENGIPVPYYFQHIKVNEENKPTDLYELIWPHSGMDNCTFEYIDELEKLKITFNEGSKRHFTQTAKILLTGLLLSDCAQRTTNVYDKQIARLEAFIAS